MYFDKGEKALSNLFGLYRVRSFHRIISLGLLRVTLVEFFEGGFIALLELALTLSRANTRIHLYASVCIYIQI